MINILSWLRQTTTVQGLAVAACTVAAQLAGGVPWPVAVGGAAAALVLLALPGQGDLSRKIGAVATDVAVLAAMRGSAASVSRLASDGLALMQGDAPLAPLSART